MSIILNGTTGVTTPAAIATTITSPAATSLTIQSAGVTAITVDTAQNVGIGSTSSGERLRLYVTPVATSEIAVFANDYTAGTARTAIRMGFSGFGYGARIVSEGNPSLTNSNSLVFERGIGAPGYAECGRFDSSGNLLVGTTNASFPVSGFTTEVNAGGLGVYTRLSIGHSSTAGPGEAFMRFLKNSIQIGSISQNSTSTAFNTSSDYRLKEAVAPMTGALAKVALLKPCTYKWKVDGSDGQGFIAHELAEVESGCVTGNKDAIDTEGNPQYQGIDTSFLVATLTAAIQEQQALIESLTNRITALENK